MGFPFDARNIRPGCVIRGRVVCKVEFRNRHIEVWYRAGGLQPERYALDEQVNND